MSTTLVVFEDLPESRGGAGRPSKHVTISAMLRDRPGEWARVHTSRTRSGADSIAHQIRTGLLPAYAPSKTYEAKGRTVDGEYRVYARYVGAGGETE